MVRPECHGVDVEGGANVGLDVRVEVGVREGFDHFASPVVAGAVVPDCAGLSDEGKEIDFVEGAGDGCSGRVRAVLFELWLDGAETEARGVR